MPTKRKRIYTAPEDKPLVALGLDPEMEGDVTSAAIAGIVARLGDMMYEAAAELDRIWRRKQWGFVAECLRGNKFPVFTPADHTAHLEVIKAIEHAHQEHRLGDGHFLDAIEGARLTHSAARKRADDRVAAMCQQLRDLTPVHGVAVLAAVRWYWAHRDELRDCEIGWWLPSVRNKIFNSRAPEPRTKKVPRSRPGGGQSLLFDPAAD